ncbi:hypothetical protein BBP40_011090 [Aspergillus hancockii]|nr:hypothetical protein BBP40_011090 [Aspergillus hancockii]
MGAGIGPNMSEGPSCEDPLAARHRDPYDADTAQEIINGAQLLQFTFPTFKQGSSEFPYVIHLPGKIAKTPTKEDPDKRTLYAKGWLPCELLEKIRNGKENVPVIVATSKAESIYVARSTFAHGLTWRSAVINGYARELTFPTHPEKTRPVTTDDVKKYEKLQGLRHIVNGYIPDQWEHTRTPVQMEVDMVLVFAVDIKPDESRVHVRHGISKYEPKWEESNPGEYWEGSIPMWQTYGEPFGGRTEVKFPQRLKDFFDDQNRKNMGYANAQAGTAFEPELN